MCRIRHIMLVVIGILPVVVSAPKAESHRLLIDPGTFVRTSPENNLQYRKDLGRAINYIGPKISLRQPINNSTFAAGEQIAVHIDFLPATDGALPNMKSLEVRVRKGWFGKNITDVVRPHIKGAAVRIPEVDFSGYTGDFEFKISINDNFGRTSITTFQISIVG